MEQIAARFRRYGAELNVLEHDLTECLNEFKQAYEVLYREPGAIAQKKFSIVYHTDNFLVRVHKFRENVYRLLALTVGLDHSAKPKRSDPSREEQVANAFERRRLPSIGKCVVQFDHNHRITAAIKERNLFVHQSREEPKRPELGAASRVRDFEDRIAAQVSAMTDLPAIDRYADRKADELLRILEAIREFRNTLYEAIEDEVVAIIAKAITRDTAPLSAFRGSLELQAGPRSACLSQRSLSLWLEEAGRHTAELPAAADPGLALLALGR
jgi:hypothetical protein